ncbi:helix-turn-helix domain-containing protein [Agrobacterium tumefaciens]|uniref:helix-turn-helix domain-containing protein n=1 Tax=Agrobacterium tumefaciens TaxID=358 RepID=UPI00157362CE|nr:hypothetical protein [Agrobacterium tumefaciens]
MAQDGALPNPTQAKLILKWLQSGNRITPTQALNKFGCFRLGARIYDLRRDGHNIMRDIVTVTTRGGGIARVAEYFIPEPPGRQPLPGQISFGELVGGDA